MPENAFLSAHPGSGEDLRIVSGSKIQMLGLDAIKLRLGPRWDRMSDLVHRYFKAAIKCEMSPGDTFCDFGELSYFLLFRDLSVAEAQLKCAAVIQSVCRRLFGEQGEDIAVRNLVAAVDAISLDTPHARARLDRALERDGREVIFSNKNGGAVPKAEQCIRVRAGSSPAAVHTVSSSKPAFVYRPLWDTARNVVLTYICHFLPDTISGGAVSGCPFMAAEGEADQLTLDILAFRECLQRASQLRSAGLRVLLAAPLHFNTLCRQSLWAQYSAVPAPGSVEQFRDIAFVVHGFDVGIPNIRLVHELPKLSRFSKHVFCISEDDEGFHTRFRNTGIHALGIALSPGKPERQVIARMNALVRDARENAMESFALGISKRSVAINAIGAGVRYLEGPTVRASVADPKHAFVHVVEDLYRDRDYAAEERHA